MNKTSPPFIPPEVSASAKGSLGAVACGPDIGTTLERHRCSQSRALHAKRVALPLSLDAFARRVTANGSSQRSTCWRGNASHKPWRGCVHSCNTSHVRRLTGHVTAGAGEGVVVELRGDAHQRVRAFCTRRGGAATPHFTGQHGQCTGGGVLRRLVHRLPGDLPQGAAPSSKFQNDDCRWLYVRGVKGMTVAWCNFSAHPHSPHNISASLHSKI